MIQLDTVNHKPSSTDDGVIPLINVVFLMLIFFMIAGQIQRSDAVAITPPNSISEIKKVEEPYIVLMRFDGALYFQDQPLEQQQLVEELSRLLTTTEQPDQIKLLVKADAQLPVDKLKSLLKVLKSSGLQHVSLATRYQARDAT
jgi:biopolymer transport protein ExbD